MQPANIPEEAIEKMELYCSTWSKDEVIGHKLKQVPIEYERGEKDCEVNTLLKQIAQKGCGASILRDFFQD